MKSNIAEQLAPHYIAAFLSKCGCETFAEVVEAMQVMIDTSKETQTAYAQNGEAQKAVTVPSIN